MPETRNTYRRITRSARKVCTSNNLNKSVETPLKNITNDMVSNKEKSGGKLKTSPMKRRSSDFTSPGEESTTKSHKLKKGKKENEATDHNDTRKSKNKNSDSAGPSGVNIQDESSIPEQSNNGVDDLFKICKGLSNTLGSKYINVIDRLKLDSEPYCIKNMYFCHINHSKKCPRTPSKVNMLQVLDARSLSANNRHLHFLKRVEDMCLRSEFPGETIMYKILEIILTINPPEHESDTSKEVITECVLVFEHILRKFPPCWHDIHENYKNLLSNPMDIKKILQNGKYCEENIYTFVLSTMESVLSELETPEKLSDDGDSFWESKYDPKHYFNLHSRTDKLERLFIVLHLVTKILEFDLSLWMLRHLSKPGKHLFGEKRPLVVTVFGLDPYKHITLIVKKTLNIFVRCACFSYPEEDVSILSRIISLLAVTINLEEINSNNSDRFTFPHYDRKTTEFCVEIFNTVDSIFGRCIIDYVTIINNIKIPLIKYLLIDHLLNKMNNDQGEMSPEKIALNFRKKRWLQCQEQIEPRKTRRISSSKYPIIPKNVEKPKCDDIYRHEYLKLLLDALEAYCDVYDIKNWISLFKNNTETEIKTPKRISSENQRSKLSKNDILNLDLMESDIEDLEIKLNIKQKRKPLVFEASIFEGIQVNEEIMTKCRKDIKYLLVLQKNLDIFRNEYGKVFDNWIDFIRGKVFQFQQD